MKNKIDEKRLYEIVEAAGETLNGALHIINQSRELPYRDHEQDGEFRVYHINGYCFDIKKEFICEENDIKYYQDVWLDGFSYSFSQEWDGFKNDLTIKAAFELIKNNIHIYVK